MKEDAIDTTVEAFRKYNVEINKNEIAGHIVNAFNQKYQPSWSCILGDICSYIPRKRVHYIYFFLDNVAVVLFKTVQ